MIRSRLGMREDALLSNYIWTGVGLTLGTGSV